MYARHVFYAIPVEENIKFLVDGPLWFLPALFLAYLLTNAVQGVRVGYRVLYVVFSIVFTASCTRLPVFLPWCLDEVFVASLFLMCGFYFKNHSALFESSHPKKTFWVWFCAAFLLYICLVYVNGPINMAFRNYGTLGDWSLLLFFVIGILGTYVWYRISQCLQHTPVGTLLAFVGRMSLRLMCIHIPLYEALAVVCGKWNSLLASLFMVIMVIAVCYMMELVFNRYKKRIPLLQYL